MVAVLWDSKASSGINRDLANVYCIQNAVLKLSLQVLRSPLIHLPFLASVLPTCCLPGFNNVMILYVCLTYFDSPGYICYSYCHLNLLKKFTLYKTFYWQWCAKTLGKDWAGCGGLGSTCLAVIAKGKVDALAGAPKGGANGRPSHPSAFTHIFMHPPC